MEIKLQNIEQHLHYYFYNEMKDLKRQQQIEQRYSPQNQNAALKETVFTLFPSIKEDSSLRIYKQTQNAIPSIHIRINPLYEHQIFTMYNSIKKAYDFYQRFNQNDFWENVVCASDELKGDKVTTGQQIGFSSKDELRDTKNLLRDLKVQIAFKHSILQAILTESLSMSQQHHDLVYSYADKSSVKPKNHIKLYVEQEVKKIKDILSQANQDSQQQSQQHTEQRDIPHICSPFRNSGFGLVKSKRLQRMYWEKSHIYGEQIFKDSEQNDNPEMNNKHKLLETLFGGNLLSYWYGFQIPQLNEVVEISDADSPHPRSFIGHGIEPSQLPESDVSFFLSRQINAFTIQLIRSFLGKNNKQDEQNVSYFGSTITQEAIKHYSKMMFKKNEIEDVKHEISITDQNTVIVDVKGLERAFMKTSTANSQQQNPSQQIQPQNPISIPAIQSIKQLGIGPGVDVKQGLSLGPGARAPLNIAKPVTSMAPAQQTRRPVQVPRLQNVVISLEPKQKINSTTSDVSAVTIQSLTQQVIQPPSTATKQASAIPTMGLDIPKATPGFQLQSIGLPIAKNTQGPNRDPLSSLRNAPKPVIPQKPIEQTNGEDNTSFQSRTTIRTTVGQSTYMSGRKDFSQLLAKPGDLISKHITKQQLIDFLPLFQTFYMLQRQFLMVLYKINTLNNASLEGANMIQKGLDDIFNLFSGNQGNALKTIFVSDMIKKQIQDRLKQLKATIV